MKITARSLLLAPLTLSARPAVHIKAWAVSLRGHQLRVLLIDKGRRGAEIRLHVPARGPATVERLLAPGVSATAGVTLAGQRLGPSGRWIGRRITQPIMRHGSGYEVSLPAHSAALVSVR